MVMGVNHLQECERVTMVPGMNLHECEHVTIAIGVNCLQECEHVTMVIRCELSPGV